VNVLLVPAHPGFPGQIPQSRKTVVLCVCDNQFGFKKGHGCNHAIFTARNIIERLINDGSTINLCTLDVSKAFDKVNHSALFTKLMKRQIPLALLHVLENWLNNSWTCVKWYSVYSRFIKIKCGVRQGSVLSPSLFAVYLDDIISLLPFSQRHCIILYADDILIISPSVNELQNTHNTHNRFTAGLEYVRVHPGQQVPER